MPSRKTAAPPRKDEAPTAAELRGLLAQLLAGAAGGTEERWADLIGEVEMLPIVLHPTCNWRVKPDTSGKQIEAIAKAVEVVRGAHPYARR